MAIFISRSPDETFGLGEQWGRVARPRGLIGLSGDLGTGKTHLVKGLARGLGVTVPVRSPTFALVHQYEGGRLTLVHLDFYRLDTAEQIHGAGLDEFLNRPAGVTVVEWIERWLGTERQAPETTCQGPTCPFQASWYRHVRMEWLSQTERRITYEDIGA